MPQAKKTLQERTLLAEVLHFGIHLISVKILAQLRLVEFNITELLRHWRICVLFVVVFVVTDLDDILMIWINGTVFLSHHQGFVVLVGLAYELKKAGTVQSDPFSIDSINPLKLFI